MWLGQRCSGVCQFQCLLCSLLSVNRNKLHCNKLRIALIDFTLSICLKVKNSASQITDFTFGYDNLEQLAASEEILMSR